MTDDPDDRVPQNICAYILHIYKADDISRVFCFPASHTMGKLLGIVDQHN